MECSFNGILILRKGDIVKITKAIMHGAMRVSVLENITTGMKVTGPEEGVMMASPPVYLEKPIEGKIVSSEIRYQMSGSGHTTFTIA